MKLIDGVILIENNGEHFLITVGKATEKYSGMIRLNDTAHFVAEALKSETDEEAILAAVLAKYDVGEAEARESVSAVTEQLKSLGLVAE